MHNTVKIPPLQLTTLQKWWSTQSQASLALQIKLVAQCDSTNLQLCHTQNQHNTLFITEHQTHGRGQFDRSWVSSTGDLIFSIGLLLPPSLVPALSLRVGLALAQVCALYGWHIELKWPNDLIATHPDTTQKGKLAGILIQNQVANDGINSWVVIGIGLNIGARLLPNSPSNQETPAFPPIGVAQLDSTWIQPTCGQREDLLMQIVDTTLVHIGTATPTPDPQLAQAWNTHDLWHNADVIFTEALGITRHGLGRGVNANGAYQLEIDNSLRTFHSGQLRLAPSAV